MMKPENGRKSGDSVTPANDGSGADSQIRTCEDALRQLAAHLDGELEVGLHDEVERHLSICRSCYSRAQFEERLRSSIRQLGREPVPSGLSERVQTLIRTFTVAGGD
jgi:anti-sigma factor (TIGR02949 family)